MWHRAFVVSGLVFLAACPNKNSPERQMRAAVQRFEEFTGQMCRCKDKACADSVQEKMTKWGTEMAKEARKDLKPDEETMKKMTELGQKYADCMTKAMSDGPTFLGEPAKPAERDDIPLASKTRDADGLLREARAWALIKQREHVVMDAQFDYVDAAGELDQENGRVAIAFGRTSLKKDDPKRKIGAPVKQVAIPDDCFQITWTPAAGWSRTTYGCSETFDVVNRCSVTAVWRKALDKKAPETALARLEMRPTSAGASWSFVIEDEPRDVHIDETFADDCPLAVEK